MLRVSADTNTILSGIFFDKNPEKMLLLAIDGKFTLILPLSIVKEVDEKIRLKEESVLRKKLLVAQ
jgi:predicted nucleic acid-binding protein